MGRHGRAAEASVTLAGRYRLIESVGRGTMGEVWAAEDAALRRMVAVKLLDPAPVPDRPASTTRADAADTTSERVWREARGAARLAHTPTSCGSMTWPPMETGDLLPADMAPSSSPTSALPAPRTCTPPHREPNRLQA